MVGDCLGLVAAGCDAGAGPVGLAEHAPNDEATDTSMTKRKVRDIVRSRIRERHRYDRRHAPTDIAGDSVICGGTH